MKKSEATFVANDRALFVHVKPNGTTVMIPVWVERVLFRVVLDVLGPKEIADPWVDRRRTELHCYIVKSDRGGSLRVSPGSLRPDTVLDRMAIAVSGGPAIEEQDLHEVAARGGPFHGLLRGQFNTVFARAKVGQSMIPPH